MKLQDLINQYLQSPEFENFNIELQYFKNLDFLKEAIKYACLGIYEKEDGTLRYCDHYDHVYDNYKAALFKSNNKLQSSFSVFDKNIEFQELYDFIGNEIRPFFGIGALMQYDISLRIGSFFKIKPTKLYAQRGSLWGFNSLYQLDEKEPLILEFDDVKTAFPEFNIIEEVSHLENFLCINHKELNKIR